MSGPISKFSMAGGLSVPSLTVKLLSFGRVERLLTAVTNALRFKRIKDNRPLASGLHSCRRSSSSSVVKRQAEDTNMCFLAYSSISSAILHGQSMVESSPRPTVTIESFKRHAWASGW